METYSLHLKNSFLISKNRVLLNAEAYSLFIFLMNMETYSFHSISRGQRPTRSVLSNDLKMKANQLHFKFKINKKWFKITCRLRHVVSSIYFSHCRLKKTVLKNNSFTVRRFFFLRQNFKSVRKDEPSFANVVHRMIFPLFRFPSFFNLTVSPLPLSIRILLRFSFSPLTRRSLRFSTLNTQEISFCKG